MQVTQLSEMQKAMESKRDDENLEKRQRLIDAEENKENSSFSMKEDEELPVVNIGESETKENKSINFSENPQKTEISSNTPTTTNTTDNTKRIFYKEN